MTFQKSESVLSVCRVWCRVTHLAREEVATVLVDDPSIRSCELVAISYRNERRVFNASDVDNTKTYVDTLYMIDMLLQSSSGPTVALRSQLAGRAAWAIQD